MRRFFMFVIFLALAVVLLPWLHPRAEAAVIGPDQARVAKFWIGKTCYEVDGKRYEMDVAPYVKNGRTMMPARFLAVSLGIPEENITWDEHNQTVSIGRGGDFHQDPGANTIFMKVGEREFNVNGYVNITGKFDVPPEIVPPGRTMIPYRAVAQALGALVFWDEATQCVTVETWREVPPPTPMTVKKVTVYKDALYADVVRADGTEARVETEHPAMITDVRDGGYTLDAIEWFKLWGVPESNMLYDPARGGLAVRAGNSHFSMSQDDIRGMVAAGYLYFYKSEKEAWDNFFMKVQVNDGANYNFIGDNGKLYGDSCVSSSVSKLFGKRINGSGTPDFSSKWTGIVD